MSSPSAVTKTRKLPAAIKKTTEENKEEEEATVSLQTMNAANEISANAAIASPSRVAGLPRFHCAICPQVPP